MSRWSKKDNQISSLLKTIVTFIFGCAESLIIGLYLSEIEVNRLLPGWTWYCSLYPFLIVALIALYVIVFLAFALIDRKQDQTKNHYEKQGRYENAIADKAVEFIEQEKDFDKFLKMAMKIDKHLTNRKNNKKK